jgi:acetyl-CoA synthetase
VRGALLASGGASFEMVDDVGDGERFHGWGSGRGDWASCRCSAPWRLGAVQLVHQREGGFGPEAQIAFLSRHEVTNVFTTPTALRSMMAIVDAGTRYAQRFRRVCWAGGRLSPEAIRWFRGRYAVAEAAEAAANCADGTRLDSGVPPLGEQTLPVG